MNGMTGRRTTIIITALSVAVLVLGFVAVVKAQPPQLEKSASASVEVVGSNSLRVDLIYKKYQRVKVMKLIEGVDQYLWDEEERQIQEL